LSKELDKKEEKGDEDEDIDCGTIGRVEGATDNMLRSLISPHADTMLIPC
jgi:hypothetical protein